MPRTARVVAAGVPHHVTQRGNNRQPVFLADSDRVRYLRFMREEGSRHGLRVLGYCLMSNHVHLVAVPETKQSLGKAVGRAHYAYTYSLRKTRGGSGHLWQGRYYSTPLDDAHLVTALAYVDLNPVRARLLADPERYHWSSARAHLSGRDPTGILDMDWWRQSCLSDDWRDRLLAGLTDEQTAEVRQATITGRPPWKVTVDSQV